MCVKLKRLQAMCPCFYCHKVEIKKLVHEVKSINDSTEEFHDRGKKHKLSELLCELLCEFQTKTKQTFQELDLTLGVYNPFLDDISSQEIRQNHVFCRSKNSDTILSMLLKKSSLYIRITFDIFYIDFHEIKCIPYLSGYHF